MNEPIVWVDIAEDADGEMRAMWSYAMPSLPTLPADELGRLFKDLFKTEAT